MVSREGTEANYAPHVPFVGGAEYAGEPYALPRETLKKFSALLPKTPPHEERASEAEVTAALNKISLMVVEATGSPRQSALRGLMSSLSRLSTRNEIKEAVAQGNDILEAIKTAEAAEKADHEAHKHKEKMAHLWGEIGKAREELKAMGYGDDEYEKERKKKQDELAKLTPGSEAHKAKQLEIADLDKRYAVSTNEKAKEDEKAAIAAGDEKGADNARKAQKQSGIIIDSSDALANNFTKKNASTTKSAPVAYEEMKDEQIFKERLASKSQKIHISGGESVDRSKPVSPLPAGFAIASGVEAGKS